MRWLHISDLHLGRPDLGESEDKTCESLIEHVEERVHDGLGPDYLFLTGDLTWDGTAKAVNRAATFVQKLIEVAGLKTINNDDPRLFAVAGNHDVEHSKGADGKAVFVPTVDKGLHAGLPGANLQDALKRSRELMAPNIDAPGFKEFGRFVRDSTSKKVYPHDNHFLTFSHVSTGTPKVGIIGINTAWASCQSSNEGNGTLPCGAKLVRTAISAVKEKEPTFVFVLAHHPSNVLYDIDPVLTDLSQLGIPYLYLRGHTHMPSWRAGQDNTGQRVEIGTGAAHQDLERTDVLHRILWGRLKDSEFEIEPLYQHREVARLWVLDTWAYPTSQDYRLHGRFDGAQLQFPQQRRKQRTESSQFVGIGSSAFGTIGSLKAPFDEKNDFKADATRLWEPELGTFATIVGAVLARWGRPVGLITSMGDDERGRNLRRLLSDRSVRLLFLRDTEETSRQVVLTPRDKPIRYNVDRHIDRPELTDADKERLERCIPKVLSSNWIALDKYEIDLFDHIVKASDWENVHHPFVLFETGSRPRRETGAAGPTEQGEIQYRELLLSKYYDVFTAPSEWMLALARQKDIVLPDNLSDITELVRQVSSVLPQVIHKAQLKPYLCLITLSKWGVLAAWRNPGSAEIRTKTISPLQVGADLVESRLGAGDLLRAVLLEGLLQKGTHPSTLVDAFSREEVPQEIQVALYGAKRWITRKMGHDYFGDFPVTYLQLVDEWKRQASLAAKA